MAATIAPAASPVQEEIEDKGPEYWEEKLNKWRQLWA